MTWNLLRRGWMITGTTTSVVALTSCLSLLAGCGALSNDDDDDSPTPGVTPTPDGTTSIVSINQGGAVDGDVLTIKGLVTAITYKGDFWVSDPDGGEYSGIYIFDEYEGKGAAAGIETGDEVTITGVYQLFYGVREIVIYADDGLVTIDTKAKGMPTPVTMTDLSKFKLDNPCDADLSAALEPYMGTYMQLPQATITSAAGACETNPTYGMYEMSDSSGNAVLVDDDTDQPYEPVVDDIIQVNGVLFFSDYNNIGNYKIMPSVIDVIQGEEPTPTPTPAGDLTIQDINQNPPAPDTIVTVQGVVTLIDANKNFWIQDVEGGLWSGMYIYDQKNLKGQAAGIAAGDLVEVTGAYKLYYDLNEIQPYQEAEKGAVTILQKGAGMPEPIVIDDVGQFSIADTCSTTVDSDAAPYVGVLVSFKDMLVNAAYGTCATDAKLKIWDAKDASGDKQVVYSGNVTSSYTPAVGDSVDLTGVLYYSFSKYELVPLNDTGVVKK